MTFGAGDFAARRALTVDRVSARVKPSGQKTALNFVAQSSVAVKLCVGRYPDRLRWRETIPAVRACNTRKYA